MIVEFHISLSSLPQVLVATIYLLDRHESDIDHITVFNFQKESN